MAKKLFDICKGQDEDDHIRDLSNTYGPPFKLPDISQTICHNVVMNVIKRVRYSEDPLLAICQFPPKNIRIDGTQDILKKKKLIEDRPTCASCNSVYPLTPKSMIFSQKMYF